MGGREAWAEMSLIRGALRGWEIVRSCNYMELGCPACVGTGKARYKKITFYLFRDYFYCYNDVYKAEPTAVLMKMFTLVIWF